MTKTRATFRFRLRTVFVLITAVALVSEVMRFALGLGELPFVIALLSFAYGGLAGLICFAFVGVMSVLVARDIRHQFVVLVVGAVAATAIWTGVIIVVTYRWVPLCVLCSCGAGVMMVLTARNEVLEQENQQLQPDVTLARLRQAKEDANVESPLGRETMRNG